MASCATASGGDSGGVLKLPFSDIQPNWDEVVRSSRLKKVWVSCRQPEEKSENSELIKGENGKLQGQEGGRFLVTKQNSWSVTVSHARARLATTFVRPRKIFELFNKQVHCVDVSESGGLGVCSADDGKLWVWDTGTGETRRNLEGHVGDVYSCRFFPSGVVVLSGGADMRLKIWSAQNGSCARTLTGHTRGIADTAIIDRGRNFISVSSDGSGRLWDCGSGQCLDTIASTGCAINSCAIASDSSMAQGRDTPPKVQECGTNDKLLLVACEDGFLRCYDVWSRKPSAQSKERLRTKASAQQQPETPQFASSQPNQLPKVVIHKVGGSPLTSCSFLSSSLVITGAEDGVFTTLDIRNPSSGLSAFQFYESPIRSVQAVPGNRCFAAFRNGSSVIWGTEALQSQSSDRQPLEITSLTGPESDPITSAASSAGHVYTSCRDGVVRAYAHSDINV